VTLAAVRRRGGRVILFALLCAAPATAVAQPAAAAVVAVVAVGEGRTFSAALATAIRMALESGAGATVLGSVSSNGDRVTSDSIRAVSRGVVKSYAVLDSAAIPGGARARILAMVSRISERDAVGARATRVAAPGDLWAANAELESGRSADEGRVLADLFGAIDRQPSAFSYEVESGPPVQSDTKLRVRLRIIRTPAAAYDALRDRALSILSAVAGPAGSRTIHLPPLPVERIDVRPCVSHCSSGERRLLNPRAALDETASPHPIDPPVVTAASSTPVPTLFPALRTAGGFAVVFADSVKKRQELVHVRSTPGYLGVVDYLRTTFDDARFRITLGIYTIDALQTFRAPLTGQPQARFSSSTAPDAPAIALVQGFRPHTSGGPGAPTTLGVPYVITTVPASAQLRPDTALIDVILSPAQLARVREVGVGPLATTRRAGDAAFLPSTAAPTAEAGAQRDVPLAVLDAIARPPLSEGDGAVAISNALTVVAVGSGTIDAAVPTQACAVARLRAQRELVRFLTGSHLESRIGLSASETRGGQVQEQFREEISETIAGRLAGAALAAQWTVSSPSRCRVALWLGEPVTIRRDSVARVPR
jgi:hypothetical protein